MKNSGIAMILSTILLFGDCHSLYNAREKSGSCPYNVGVGGSTAYSGKESDPRAIDSCCGEPNVDKLPTMLRSWSSDQNVVHGCCKYRRIGLRRADALEQFPPDLFSNFPVEGSSFCLAHSQFNNILEKAGTGFQWDSVDIGNFVNPADRSLMNTFNTKTGTAECSRSDGSAYENRPPEESAQKNVNCRNPYRVKMTEVSVNGYRLHNWLHIQVYAVDVGNKEEWNCPTGKMKFLMLEIRDQMGFPVGEFVPGFNHCTYSSNITCLKGLQCKRIEVESKNIIPCMYNPLRGILHPNIVVVHAKSSSSEEYITEVHATWRFAQQASRFKTELHAVTMIVEDTTKHGYFTGWKRKMEGEMVCKDNTNKRSLWTVQLKDGTLAQEPVAHSERKDIVIDGVRQVSHYPHIQFDWEWDGNGRANYGRYGRARKTKSVWYACLKKDKSGPHARMYGYSAVGTLLRPKKDSVGPPDFFDETFYASQNIKCSVRPDPAFFDVQEDNTGKLPVGLAFYDFSDISSRIGHHLPVYISDSTVRGSARQMSIEECSKDKSQPVMNVFNKLSIPSEENKIGYFGTRFSSPLDNDEQDKMNFMFNELKTIDEIGEQERCPCPRFGRSKSYIKFSAQRSHIIQMIVAWVFFIPVGLFVARYYKETFAQVFFFQEFWWYTSHIVSLFMALTFILGGIYVIERNRFDESKWTPSTSSHIVLGGIVITLYAIHLCLGSIRVYGMYARMFQIMLHWLFGWLEYVLSAIVIFIGGFMPSSLISCKFIFLHAIFLFMQLLIYAAMEYHMHKVDRKLDLFPPRSYLPPPVMRIFHKNAPMNNMSSLASNEANTKN